MNVPGSLFPGNWCIEPSVAVRRDGHGETTIMALREGFEPHLAVDGVTITGTDIEMLRAIDDRGSMSGAAETLGRSYPHLQRRVDEIEGAFGSLTTRIRGGSDGGGTALTSDAWNLIRQFDRLRVELSGVTAVTESVIPGTVLTRDGELATVRTAAGELAARVPKDSEAVELAIRSDAIVLMAPETAAEGHTSLRNQLPGTVSRVRTSDAVSTVVVAVADDIELEAVVTAESRDRLDLREGRDVIAAFKTTAARAIPTDI
jgi:molybdate transport system regulatory protein